MSCESCGFSKCEAMHNPDPSCRDCYFCCKCQDIQAPDDMCWYCKPALGEV